MVDDPSRERAPRVESADGVDGEKPGRLRRLRVNQRQNGEASRVVDENVDRAKALDGRCDHPFAVGGLGHVGCDRHDRRSAFVLDRRRRTDQRVLGASGDGDPRSLTGEGARDRIADPRAAAGHEGDLAVELQRLPTRRFRHRWSLAN